MAKKDNYIMYNGERLDLTEWLIPSVLAKEYSDFDAGYVRKLKWKKKHNQPGANLDYREIPELNLTLLKRE